MEPRSSPAQLHKIGLPLEECQELWKLTLAIQVAEANLRRLTARRDEIVFGWQQKHEIPSWEGWQIDLKAGVLTPPVATPNNGASSV